jgi:polyisoprenoid-binding protein YceI
MIKKLLCVSVFFCFVCPLQAKVFELDKDHTSVAFKIRHLLSQVNGQFTDFVGTCETDDKGVMVKVEGVVKAESIDTRNKKRDDHLRSADFFDVTKFADLKFSSDSFKIKPGASGKVNGQLTIHGVTKPVVFEVEYFGEVKDPWGGLRVGASANTKINRKDFGLTWNKALEAGGFLVGDDVTIQLDVEAKEVVKLAEPAAKAKGAADKK